MKVAKVEEVDNKIQVEQVEWVEQEGENIQLPNSKIQTTLNTQITNNQTIINDQIQKTNKWG